LVRPAWFFRYSLTVALIFGATGAISLPLATTLSSGGMRGVPVMVAPRILFHTLASDFFARRDGTVYVQTGDIRAMWLRDAAAQTLPYVELAAFRPAMRSVIRGVIAREARNVDVDPYANAFRPDYRVWERKWEIDSLAYPVVLAWAYNAAFKDQRLFTASLHRALTSTVTTYECERDHDQCSHYRFPLAASPYGRAGAPVGLIWSAFRASDDPTRYPYNIPQEMEAVTALHDLSDLARAGYHDEALAGRASSLAEGISNAIKRYGVVSEPRCGGTIYAYEVDGHGRFVIYDDANLPSLLGAPLLSQVSVDDPVYRRTRSCVLSSRNRYFFSGRYASGVGSPHTPAGYVWPLALMARALTSTDRAEILDQLRFLAVSAGSDGRIHESFDPNDPARYTRAEFGWANAMYAELLFRTAADLPPQPVESEPESTHRTLPASISVVDKATALHNLSVLLAAFDRVFRLPGSRPR
jgi:meiotically up-regulated gene 157 (Mug157) protein